MRSVMQSVPPISLSVSGECAPCHDELSLLCEELSELGIAVVDGSTPGATDLVMVEDASEVDFDRGRISPNHSLSLVEQSLRCLPIVFDRLEPLLEGESKELRLLTDQIVVERFKPTVYSFTRNRYGVVEGTEVLRAHFSSEVFRRMARLDGEAPFVPKSAFLGLIETAQGPLLLQRRVTDSNLEVRIKRYHIGSPLHRYRFTEQYDSTHSCGPVRRWSRFDTPVVCFDWRHPLEDGDGRRLSDEPISDDYAAVWLEDVPHAKEMARSTFEWLEELMDRAGLVLVDMCLFVDRSGRLIFGEISQDCMRVRKKIHNLEEAKSFDKDLWRSGASGRALLERYRLIYELVFGES